MNDLQKLIHFLFLYILVLWCQPGGVVFFFFFFYLFIYLFILVYYIIFKFIFFAHVAKYRPPNCDDSYCWVRQKNKIGKKKKLLLLHNWFNSSSSRVSERVSSFVHSHYIHTYPLETFCPHNKNPTFKIRVYELNLWCIHTWC